MKKNKLLFLIPYSLWIILFVIAPLVMITLNAFSSKYGLTINNFKQFFVNGTFLRMTLNSFCYAFLITFILSLIHI